jgi:hypothetical protein
MRYRHAIIGAIVTIAAGAGIIGGCATTDIIELWKNPTYQPTPLTSILVVGMQKDPLIRRIWEDAYATEFNKLDKSISVTASYSVFPGGIPDTTAIKRLTEGHKYDGVLMISRARVKETAYYVPGYYAPAWDWGPYYGYGWGDYWMRYQDVVYFPGYISYQTSIRVRTELLLPQDDGKMVWAAISNTIDPTSRKQLTESVAYKVVTVLTQEGYIK